MMRFQTRAALCAVILALGACQPSRPTGPSVAVMPGPNKPFQVFQDDDAVCRSFADRNAGPDNQANNQELLSAGVGTVLGAGLGAAIGGGRGAAIGAGAGALGGTAYGAGQAERTGRTVQQRYDIAYSQCMYSRGNQVPGYSPPPNYAPPPPPPPSSGTVTPGGAPPPPPPPKAY